MSPPDSAERPRRVGRRSIGAAVIAVAVAAGGSAAYFATADSDVAPRVTLGRSLAPLPLYRVDRLSEPRTTAHASAAERLVPVLGRPGEVAVVTKQPAQLLHVRYAHIRAMGSSAQIEMAAPAEEGFHASRRGEEHYVAVVHGHAVALFFVFGSSDGTNFAIGGGANQVSRGEALTIAHELTTSVNG